MNLWYNVYLLLSSLKIYLFKEAYYWHSIPFIAIILTCIVLVDWGYCLLLAQRHGTQGFLPQPSGVGHVELYSLCNHES